jgi:hypothetical protein
MYRVNVMELVVMLPLFSSENLIAVTLKFTWMTYTSFAIMRLLSCKVSIIFSTLLPLLSTTLYTSVAKFPALTSDHIMKD